MSLPTFEGTSPHISDRYITSEIAGAAITMGQLVYISANGTVLPTPNVAVYGGRYGLAMTTAPSGKEVSVLWRGRARATAYGTINAGDMVGPASGGSAVGLIQTIPQPSLTVSAGTALVTYLAQMLSEFATCEIGAPSGGSAIILME
jgi:hypothetical protein